MKLLSLFSGIGAFEKALTRQNIPYEIVGFSEVDKYAITAYCAIHGVSKELNLGDITRIKVEDIPNCDIITHGSPCQSFSVAGKGMGGDKGSGTRSSLMWYTINIVEHKLPKIVIWENVKGVLSKKHRHNFDEYLNELENLGYNNYYKVLNSKDYGIPQNRERIYVISIRKDIDKGTFKFPEPFDNGIRLKDLLEDEVKEKYFIDNEKAKKLLKELEEKNLLLDDRFGADSTINDPQRRDISNCITARYDAGIQNQKQIGMVVVETNNLCMPCITPDRVNKKQNGRRFKEDGDPMFTLTAQDRHGILVESKPKRLGGLYDTEKSKHQAGSVWDKEEIAPTIDTMQGGHREPLVVEEDTNKMLVVGNTVPSKHTAGRVFDTEGISPTVMYRNAKVVQISEENKLKFVGSISNKDWVGNGKKLSRNFPQGERVYDSDGIACSQTAQGGGTGSYTGLYLTEYKIRKLTPLECWRLMGFDDEDYWKARRALEETYYNGRDRSNSRMYKMAGNSIVVKTLEEIFKNLF